jgi:hypothetical protein
MKPLFIVSLLITLAAESLADGYVPCQRDRDPHFVLHQKTLGVRSEISISIDNPPSIPIGACDASNRSGVVTESICVHRLGGTLPLLHIEWLDYPQGMGAYANCYFLISPASDPTNILLRGIVPLHGRWGAGTGVGGDYSVSCSSNTLTVAKTQIVQDVAAKAKPLYHPAGDGRNLFASLVQTTVTRTYSIAAGRLQALRTELRYVAQEGDRIETVCSGLKVKAHWFQNAEDVAHPGRSILIVLPEEDAEKLYPTLDRTER